MEVACGQCTLLNPSVNKQCEACESPLLPKGWPCRECSSTLNPDPAALTCSQCHARRKVWLCGSCTLENPIGKGRCSVCGGDNPTRPLPPINLPKRPSPPIPERPKSSSSGTPGWVCEQCTYKNRLLPEIDSPASLTSCSVCGSVNPKRPPLNGVPKSPVSPRLSSANVENRRQIDEEQAKVTWEHIVAMSRATGESFVDDSFPPTTASLGTLTDVSPQHRDRISDIGWGRPYQIRTREGAVYRWALFRDPVRPSDIQQGLLGNCWFLSAMAVLAERPDLLRRIFITQRYSPQGVYQIRLCIDGSWRVIIVDDLFPVYGKNMQLAFTEGRRNQLWVPLIEKALAKALGGYSALIAGRTIEGLSILTGAPCVTISLEPPQRGTAPLEITPSGFQSGGNIEMEDEGEDGDHEFTWATLLSSNCGAGQRMIPDEEYRRLGLIPRHAYSVLDVKDLFGHRLVRLRNPWGGEYKWRGEFSEGSPQWTPELRALLITETNSAQLEGVFWMPYHHFIRYFDAVDICRVRDGSWSELRMSGVLPPHVKHGHFQPTRLIVTETSQVELTLYQEGMRHETARRQGAVDLGLVLLKEGHREGTSAGYVTSSKRKVYPFISVDEILQPGKYLVIPLSFNHWNMNLAPGDVPKCVFAVHSSKPGVAQIEAWLLQNGFAGQALIVANHSQNQWLQVDFETVEASNVVSTRGTLVTSDFIPPLHRQVLVVLSQVESSSSFYVSHRLAYRLDPPPLLPFFKSEPSGLRHTPPLHQDQLGLHKPVSIFDP